MTSCAGNDQAAGRTTVRVGIPTDYLVAAALWAAPPLRPTRLELAALGPPVRRRSGATGDPMEIGDLSDSGCKLLLSEPAPGLEVGSGVYLYLKLFDPWPDNPGKNLAFLFHAVCANLSPLENGGQALGLRFTGQAEPVTGLRALDFLNVERCGVADLSRYRDMLLRGSLAGETRLSHDIDLTILLAEPELQAPSPPDQPA